MQILLAGGEKKKHCMTNQLFTVNAQSENGLGHERRSFAGRK